MGFSVSNALKYMGYEEAASEARELAWVWRIVPMVKVIECVSQLLERYAPHMAQSIIYNAARHGKRKTELTWQEFCAARDAFLWLVFPVDTDGTCCHSFTAVDDLIFDTSTNKALKRTMETVKFICGGKELEFVARHFCVQSSNVSARQGHKMYDRLPQSNWADDGPAAVAASTSRAARKRRGKRGSKKHRKTANRPVNSEDDVTRKEGDVVNSLKAEDVGDEGPNTGPSVG